MSDLVWRSMAELGRMIAKKEVSPVEVVRAARQDEQRQVGVKLARDAIGLANEP